MRTTVDLLFTIAWAILGLVALRALVIAWGLDRRVAGAAAFAVAAAFVLGSASPFALRPRVAEQPAPPVPAPAVAALHPSGCTSSMPRAGTPAQGHVDAVAVGAGNPGPPSGTLAARSSEEFRLGGWVTAGDVVASDVCVLLDGAVIGAQVAYGGDRPDVAAALGKPSLRPSGFGVSVRLPVGRHTVSIGAAAPNGSIALLNQPIKVTVR